MYTGSIFKAAFLENEAFEKKSFILYFQLVFTRNRLLFNDCQCESVFEKFWLMLKKHLKIYKIYETDKMTRTSFMSHLKFAFKILESFWLIFNSFCFRGMDPRNGRLLIRSLNREHGHLFQFNFLNSFNHQWEHFH